MIQVEIDDKQITKALQNLKAAAGDLSPAFKLIGEDLVESTKQRFESSTGPDGQKWDANSAVTVEHKVHNVGGTKTKDGLLLTKKGEKRFDSKKPLIDEGSLSEQISYAIIGDTLEIGSSMEYAAMQQFGGTKDEFPFLWGDIPARPFLGISPEDEAKILSTIEDFLTDFIS